MRGRLFYRLFFSLPWLGLGLAIGRQPFDTLADMLEYSTDSASTGTAELIESDL
jgi:hypothetical protein